MTCSRTLLAGGDFAHATALAVSDFTISGFAAAASCSSLMSCGMLKSSGLLTS